MTEPEQGELELEGSYREPQADSELVPILTRSPLIQFALPVLRARPPSHPAAAGAA